MHCCLCSKKNMKDMVILLIRFDCFDVCSYSVGLIELHFIMSISGTSSCSSNYSSSQYVVKVEINKFNTRKMNASVAQIFNCYFFY